MGQVCEAGRRPATFREVLSVGEFRAMWAAELQSVAGDMLARVALSVLVFQRTNSAAWTALTYALTYLPDLLGGPLLAGLADRFPRRRVMVTCDLARAGLVGLMAVPAVPVPALAAVLVLVQLCGAPFAAAQMATLPLVLVGDRFDVGQAARQITVQAAQMIGFAVGGALVALLGTRRALAADAVTFLASALLVRLGVRWRATPAGTPGAATGHFRRIAAGARVIWRDPQLRAIVGLAWLAGFVVVPEGLAAVYAAEIGAGPATVGVLLAAHPLGLVVGALLIGRLVRPAWRLRLLSVLAVGAMVPLVPFAARPGVAVAVPLLMASGFCGAYQITASTAFVRLVPDAGRGQAFGLARSGLIASQGLGIVGGGALAEGVDSAATAITVAGCAGLVVGALIAYAWHRAISSVPRSITNPDRESG